MANNNGEHNNNNRINNYKWKIKEIILPSLNLSDWIRDLIFTQTWGTGFNEFR